MPAEWAIVITVLIALMILGFFRWVFYPSRSIDNRSKNANSSEGS